MSFPSSFASQVAAIMDMLVKAAVAEITKLVEDGSVVLRLEVSRKDGEIEELKRSLNLMEIELRKAQEAVITRAAEDKQEQTVKDEDEDQQAWAVYLEPKTAESPFDRTENSPETRMMVKPEPEDEHVVQEMTDKAAAEVAANLCFEADQRDEPLWPLAACSASEENSVARQQHMQIFPSHTEQFSAPENTESSHNSSSDAPVAAIMDVLAKAAVAEITKLMEDGSVVLRLEVSRKDSEIEELKRSLNLMEIELCKAQEAVITRSAEDKQEQRTPVSQALPKVNEYG
ncbi:hypothetical protein INR49_009942 [Caranx melampygus]|nr:hypothetical protein INR49_009942 [Caranx melampygus]